MLADEKIKFLLDELTNFRNSLELKETKLN